MKRTGGRREGCRKENRIKEKEEEDEIDVKRTGSKRRRRRKIKGV